LVQAYPHSVVSKLDDEFGVVRGHTFVGQQGVHEGAKHTPPRSPCVESPHGGGVAYSHHLGSAHQKVQDPVAEGGVQSQGTTLGDEL
jgi:hypothetical protein